MKYSKPCDYCGKYHNTLIPLGDMLLCKKHLKKIGEELQKTKYLKVAELNSTIRILNKPSFKLHYLITGRKPICTKKDITYGRG